MNRQASDSAMVFEQHPVRALNSLQRPANGIWLAAEHFKLGAFAKVISGFGRPAETVQNQAAVIKSPRIAASAPNGLIQRVERFRHIAGEIGVNAPAIELFEHCILPESQAGNRQHGERYEGRNEFRHENKAPADDSKLGERPCGHHNQKCDRWRGQLLQQTAQVHR
jgi:hypothetical protein